MTCRIGVVRWMPVSITRGNTSFEKQVALVSQPATTHIADGALFGTTMNAVRTFYSFLDAFDSRVHKQLISRFLFLGHGICVIQILPLLLE